MFYICRKDEDQYMKDITLLYYITICEHGRNFREDITEDIDEILSSESDPEPKLRRVEYFFLYHVPKNHELTSKQEICGLFFVNIQLVQVELHLLKYL